MTVIHLGLIIKFNTPTGSSGYLGAIWANLTITRETLSFQHFHLGAGSIKNKGQITQ